MKAVYTKHFGDKAVFENFPLELEKGKIYALSGPSGRGKTTLLRLIAGLESNESGCVNGFSFLKFSFVFQEDRLSSTMSAYNNVYYAVSPGCDENEILDAFRDLGLDDPYRKIREYSGGMKRRVSLIRAMLAESDIILLDEPFTGLDSHCAESACRFILKHQKGRTIILVTHEGEDAVSLPFDACIML